MQPQSDDLHERSRSKPTGSKLVTREETGHSDRTRQGRGVKFFLAISVPIVAIAIFITLRVWKPEQPCSGVDAPASSVRACPTGWIYSEGKCYFFSEEKRSWTSSQSYCGSHDSTLAVIESKQEKVFILRYMGTADHWIGLWRDSGQNWKWADGSEFKNTLEVRGENGDCAYLSADLALSSPCQETRKWICSQPDTYTRNKGSVRG